MSVLFADRDDAGRQLSPLLERFRGPDTVVLGLPRGGVPVAAEVARALNAPMDIIVVRKLGTPGNAELAVGAIGEQEIVVVNDDVRVTHRVSDRELQDEIQRKQAELSARVATFRVEQPALDLSDKTAVLVDDGLATGATARAAAKVARARGARRVVLAIPVAPSEARVQDLPEVDDLIVAHREDNFYGVGQFYSDFTQVGDSDVRRILAAQRHRVTR